jgi:hypothetical protein
MWFWFDVYFTSNQGRNNYILIRAEINLKAYPVKQELKAKSDWTAEL